MSDGGRARVDNLKYHELRALCKERGLPATGYVDVHHSIIVEYMLF